jgi:protein-S-isoprenylcysteine O-methyltransferase Ste14
MKVIRHIIAILALPFVVVAVVPASILYSLGNLDTRWIFQLPGYLAPSSIGVCFLAPGCLLVLRCVRLFATVGQGTLAPWDPPRKLLVVGPYQRVRNPMISGVVAILIGESVVCGSVLLLGLATFVFLLNHFYFLLSEEPGLALRFGDDYRLYMKNVPRWIPRRTHWTRLAGGDRANGPKK